MWSQCFKHINHKSKNNFLKKNTGGRKHVIQGKMHGVRMGETLTQRI